MSDWNKIPHFDRECLASAPLDPAAAKLIHAAPRIVAPHVDDIPDMGPLLADNRDLGRLPFPDCVILLQHCSRRVVVWAHEEEEEGCLFAFDVAESIDRQPWEYHQVSASVEPLYGNPDGLYTVVTSPYTKEDNEQAKVAGPGFAALGNWLLATFAYMNLHGTESLVFDPPEKLQRATRRRGQPPHNSYRVLDIDPRAYSTASAQGDGARAGVRLHAVRGHIRQLPLKPTWVRAHTRGDPALGAVVKDYRFKPE